ncbi:MAG: HEAT repeat domain-containing protein, partial [Candidatus Korobacteraceae bacterium]
MKTRWDDMQQQQQQPEIVQRDHLARVMKAPSSADQERAFQVLKTLKPGDDMKLLVPIEAASVHGNAAATAALEKRLLEHLTPQATPEAKEFISRELALIGTGQSAPALGALLSQDRVAFRARNALERIPGPEADKALRDALATTSGKYKAGVIQSIGVRRDARAVPQLTASLSEGQEIASAAASALGQIGTAEAGKALSAFQPKAPVPLRGIVTDAMMVCADRLLESGQKPQALAMLESLKGSG